MKQNAQVYKPARGSFLSVSRPELDSFTSFLCNDCNTGRNHGSAAVRDDHHRRNLVYG